jgi:hypothetical protein
MLIVEIVVGALIGLLGFTALERAPGKVLLVCGLIAFAMLLTAAFNPAVGHAWDSFVGTLAGIAKACVDVFL